MSIHLPPSSLPRVVIIGAGFGGLRLARRLAGKPFEVVLIDRHNFHQFQPLFYQVATAGLAPSAIAFPIRKVFQGVSNVHVRMADVERIDLEAQRVETSIGMVHYDKLVIATGADTNYFNNREIEEHALPMKSVQESLSLRNRILECMEHALSCETDEERQEWLNIVVVGGGPTGTEVSGALAEMRAYVLPKDYPELDFGRMEIHLLEASGHLLAAMEPRSQQAASRFLQGMGVNVHVHALVEGYNGHSVRIKGETDIPSRTLIWAAGVKGNILNGIPREAVVSNGRIKVDAFNGMMEHEGVYAIGDVAAMPEGKWERGHPQVAQAAIQQADRLAANLVAMSKGKAAKPFRYKDLGAMATIGRNRAVVDLPFMHFEGFLAWAFWLFVHLMAILGVKNKFMIFVEWMWNYITFDQSLRLVIKQKPRNSEALEDQKTE